LRGVDEEVKHLTLSQFTGRWSDCINPPSSPAPNPFDELLSLWFFVYIPACGAFSVFSVHLLALVVFCLHKGVKHEWNKQSNHEEEDIDDIDCLTRHHPRKMSTISLDPEG